MAVASSYTLSLLIYMPIGYTHKMIVTLTTTVMMKKIIHLKSEPKHDDEENIDDDDEKYGYMMNNEVFK